VTGALLVTSLSQVGPGPDPVSVWWSLAALGIGLFLLGQGLWDYLRDRDSRRREQEYWKLRGRGK
jgi:hypothetical protein